MKYHHSRRQKLEKIEIETLSLLEKKEDQKKIEEFILNQGAYPPEVTKVLRNARKTFRNKYIKLVEKELADGKKESDIIKSYSNVSLGISGIIMVMIG